MARGGLLMRETPPGPGSARPGATIAAVVPAYNEERRIGSVVEAIKASAVVDQLIVVSDGSTDGTYERMKGDRDIQAIQLRRNVGKGGAMCAGARRARADWLLFLDADLIGLTPDHIHRLLGPIVNDEADMAVGIFHGGRFLTDLSQYIAPSITGQRVIPRSFFLSLPGIQDVRYGVETAITFHARCQGLRIGSVVLQGVTHPLKEEKLGALRGGMARARMYYEIGRYLTGTLGHSIRERTESHRTESHPLPLTHRRP